MANEERPPMTIEEMEKELFQLIQKQWDNAEYDTGFDEVPLRNFLYAEVAPLIEMMKVATEKSATNREMFRTMQARAKQAEMKLRSLPGVYGSSEQQCEIPAELERLLLEWEKDYTEPLEGADIYERRINARANLSEWIEAHCGKPIDLAGTPGKAFAHPAKARRWGFHVDMAEAELDKSELLDDALGEIGCLRRAMRNLIAEMRRREDCGDD